MIGAGARRIISLIRLFVITHRRAVLVTTGTVYAILLALFLLGAITGMSPQSPDYHRAYFPPTFLLVGFITISMSFAGMHRADRSYIYLTLPASHLEKLAEKLILSMIVYPLTAAASYFVFSLLLTGVSRLVFDAPFGLFDPRQIDAARVLRIYVVVGSVFLFGAAYFRGRHFLKTVLSVAAVFSLLFFVGAATGLASLAPLVRDLQSGFAGDAGAVSAQLQELGLTAARVVRIARIGAVWVLPPVLWLLTWLRLTEAEVSDAVR